MSSALFSAGVTLIIFVVCDYNRNCCCICDYEKYCNLFRP